MKKVLSLFLCAIILIGITGCGNKESKTGNKEYKIGDTMQNDNFEMTLKSIDFTDSINMLIVPDPKFSDYEIGSPTFLLPIDTEDETTGWVADEDETILVYTLEYKYIGKKEYDGYSTFGRPIVKFNGDYTFNSNYLSARQDGNYWRMFSYDISKLNFNNMVNCSTKYEPLEEEVYSVRGAIKVPKKLKEETKKSLTIRFDYLGSSPYKIR